MKNMNRYINAAFSAIFLILASACNKQPGPVFEQQTRMVSDCYFHSMITVYRGEPYCIDGSGFIEGDVISFRDAADASVRYDIAVENVLPKSCTVLIPLEMEYGYYNIYLIRGEREQFLAQSRFSLTIRTDVPDKAGATIKGMVYCQERGVPGVRVSDGMKTTVTDENGFYWLESEKSNGYVFISIPSGYMPEEMDAARQGFWCSLEADRYNCELHNFSLKECSNDNFSLITAADIHLANKLNDKDRFRAGFLAETSAFARQSEKPVFCIFLGDVTWDRYWYDNDFRFPHFRELMVEYGYEIPYFCIMGNHDNDPYQVGDFYGEAAYKKELGPSWYSFNLGKAHFVVLDDIIWTNDGGADGVVGSRNFTGKITQEQLKWLKEDLSAVEDKTAPLFIALHIQVYENYNSTFSPKERLSASSGGAADLLKALDGFTNVHLLSGHTHFNANIEINSNVYEHNHAALCETWWWSSALSGRAVCVDGTPSGYGIFDVSGSSVTWRYKGVGENAEKQFRTYDMNKVKEQFETSYVKDILAKYSSRNNGGDDYGDVGENVVFINVWNWDSAWNISVKEGTSELPVTRIYQRDPLHTLSFDIPRVEQGYDATYDWASVQSSHIFMVQASSPDSDLKITVTDRFGNSSEEMMDRPKVFDITMN